jgi:hypothetical protein
MTKSCMYFSVDIETDGPVPGAGSMLSIGISALHPDTMEEVASFYRKLERLPDASTSAETMRWWDGFLPEYLEARTNPEPPEVVMRDMDKFVRDLCKKHALEDEPATPVFVAWPATFDFSFVSYYCHRFLGQCVFGYAGLDIKSLAMGLLAREFHQTTKENFLPEWKTNLKSTHHALDDAREQADHFRKMIGWRRNRRICE